MSTPRSIKSLRACLKCKLIKSYTDFEKEGCDNCKDLEDVAVNQYTTPTFHGMIAMMQPSESWVARWQRQDGKVRGLYAILVVGELNSSASGGE